MVLDLKGLRVEARPHPSYFDRWFNCRIAVTARPFAGVLETIFTDEDLIELADALDRLDLTGEAMLGGDRATELRLVVAHQDNGPKAPSPSSARSPPAATTPTRWSAG